MSSTFTAAVGQTAAVGRSTALKISRSIFAPSNSNFTKKKVVGCPRKFGLIGQRMEVPQIYPKLLEMIIGGW